MKRLLAVLLLLPFLSGCLLWDCGYTRNDDTAIYQTGESNKIPLTYSLNFDHCSCLDSHAGAPTIKSIRTKVEETLKETGLFSDVLYDNKGKVGYHVEFTYKDAGNSYDQAVFWGIVCAYTLCSIPIPENYSADLSAVVYLEGKPVWSVAHTEKCRLIHCWYALPFGLFLNYWSVWSAVENGIVCATVNDFAKEHIKRYLDPASVRLTNPDYAGGE